MIWYEIFYDLALIKEEKKLIKKSNINLPPQTYYEF